MVPEVNVLKEVTKGRNEVDKDQKEDPVNDEVVEFRKLAIKSVQFDFEKLPT